MTSTHNVVTAEQLSKYEFSTACDGIFFLLKIYIDPNNMSLHYSFCIKSILKTRLLKAVIVIVVV